MKRLLWLSCVFLLLLSGCGAPQAEDWGSFTPEKTHSYDEALYAVQSTQKSGGVTYVEISVCSAENDEVLCTFIPARARDFRGVCWESDSYNLWIQSGDIGVVCYACEDGVWQIDPSAVRPENIVSKYD